MHVDALGLLKYVRDVVLFLLSCIDGKRSEKVKHDTVVKRLARHSPWAFQWDTLKVHIWVAFRLLDNDLVPNVLALGRKQVQVEREHQVRGSGHCALSSLLGLLGLLKISLEASFHQVISHCGRFFSILGLWLGFLGLCKGFLCGFLGLRECLLLALWGCPSAGPLDQG